MNEVSLITKLKSLVTNTLSFSMDETPLITKLKSLVTNALRLSMDETPLVMKAKRDRIFDKCVGDRAIHYTKTATDDRHESEPTSNTPTGHCKSPGIATNLVKHK